MCVSGDHVPCGHKLKVNSEFLRFYLRVFAGFGEAGGGGVAAVHFLSTAGGRTSWVNHIHSRFIISNIFLSGRFIFSINKSIHSALNLPASLGHFGSTWVDSWLLEKETKKHLEHFDDLTFLFSQSDKTPTSLPSPWSFLLSRGWRLSLCIWGRRSGNRTTEPSQNL